MIVPAIPRPGPCPKAIAVCMVCAELRPSLSSDWGLTYAAYQAKSGNRCGVANDIGVGLQSFPVWASRGSIVNSFPKMEAHVVAIVSGGLPQEWSPKQCVANANSTRHTAQQTRDTLELP